MDKSVLHYQAVFDAEPINPILAINALKTRAMKAFSEQGLPTTKTEAWRYLRLTDLREQPFELMQAGLVEKEAIAALLWQDCYHLVCVNGFWVPALSDLPSLPGVSCQSLSDALACADIQALLDQTDLNMSLLALNTALFQDGLVLHVADGCTLDKPIQCLFVTNDQGAAKTSQQRHVVRLGAGASVRLIVQHVSFTDSPTFTNALWHMELAAQSTLNYLQVFSGNAIHIDHCLLNQQAHSVYNGLSFMKNGHLVRSDLDQCFKGEHARCSVKGLSVSHLDQQMDHHLRIRHAAAHCFSEQFFKGVALDQSRLVFNGKVVVDKDAQKTDAHQHFKHLLLSHKAEIFTKPELEIYANDVKCAHGATVGQLSDEALFYLKSRGIQNAKEVLIAAFNQELLDQVDLPDLKAWLSDLFKIAS